MVRTGVTRSASGAGADLTQVDQEQAEATGACAARSRGVGAGQQHQQVGLLDAAGPVLVAVDDVLVAVSAGGGGDVGVSDPASGSVIENACRRSSPLAIAGQIAPASAPRCRAAERAHRVHLGVAGRRVPAGAVDLLHDHARLGDAEPQAAVLGRDERREIAGLGERVDERLRVGPLAGLAAASTRRGTARTARGSRREARDAVGDDSRRLLPGQADRHPTRVAHAMRSRRRPTVRGLLLSAPARSSSPARQRQARCAPLPRWPYGQA